MAGMVSFTTFKTMMAGKGFSGDALLDAFNVFDEDRTGAIESSELSHVIESLNNQAPMSEKDRATEEAKRKMNLKMGQAIDYISSILGGMVAKEFEAYKYEKNLTERGAILFRHFDELNNGVYLCQMMNKIWPNSIGKINVASSAQIPLHDEETDENISAFRNACISYANLDERKVPQVDEFGVNSNPLVLAACITMIQNAAHLQGTDDDHLSQSEHSDDLDVDSETETASVAESQATVTTALSEVASESSHGGDARDDYGDDYGGGVETAPSGADQAEEVKPRFEAPDRHLVHKPETFLHHDQEEYRQKMMREWNKTLLGRFNKNKPPRGWQQQYERHHGRKTLKKVKKHVEAQKSNVQATSKKFLEFSMHRVGKGCPASSEGYGMRISDQKFDPKHYTVDELHGDYLPTVTMLTEGDQKWFTSLPGKSKAHRHMPAETHGVHVGHTILMIDGEHVESSRDVDRVLSEKAYNDEVKFLFHL